MHLGDRMRVLAIIGSPRKGNSYEVTQQIERALRKNENLQFEYLFLSQVNLQPCRGCYTCITRGEQHCPLKDERESIVQKMRGADGVIFVSPVYTLNVSGLMKNFMDRMGYNAHRPAFLGKPAMLVATAAGPGTTDTMKALSWFSVTGFEIVSRLGVIVYPSHDYAPAHQQKVDKQIERAARQFEKALNQCSSPPSLLRVIQFYALKANAMFGQAVYLADYAYYKDRENYHLDVKVSWWKQLLGRFFYQVSTQWMGRNFVRPEEESST
jgi:multimeric flavodoxin WrbA